MKFTEGAFKNYGYDLAEEEFGGHVFTWRQYENQKEKGKQRLTISWPRLNGCVGDYQGCHHRCFSSGIAATPL